MSTKNNDKPRIIHHRNEWGWGKSITCITDNGYGTATLGITKEHEYDEEQDKLVVVDQAVISNVSVHHTHRCMGYGDMLLKECEDEALKAGFDTVYLWATPNSVAFEWYKRRGYVQCPELCIIPTGDEDLTSEATVKMKKQLK